MQHSNASQRANAIQRAVRLALSGAVAAGLPAGFAVAQDQAADQTTDLGKQTVTGSRIRRIDTETSSPVFTIDRGAIERTGAVTLGALLQEAPVIAGAASNPQVNNGDGSGASTISLRGIGGPRTLVLLNGRRLLADFDTAIGGVGVDVNAIPINLIERVEVLKDGASAIYGTDAIGGVVNFITRKEFDGFEFTALRGESAEDDAGLDSYQIALGSAFEAGHFMLGAIYDKRDPVISADRPFSEDPFALYNGQQVSVGSSRTDSGFYRLSRASAAGFLNVADPACNGNEDTATSVVLTRIDGRPGSSVGDYRCYVGDGAGNDTYDFQDVNVVVTPQERYGVFVNGERNVSDGVTAFAEGMYHFTTSNFQIAPEPFDGRPAQANINASGGSIYNPFGEDLVNQDLRLRLVNVGNRVGFYETNRFLLNTGLQGELFKDWRWQAVYSWAQARRDREEIGELYSPGIANAIGDSFRDNLGVARCGTAPDGSSISGLTAPQYIQGCTPVNFFGNPTTPEEAEEAAAAFATIVPKRHRLTKQDQQIASLNVDGDLLELPAGPLGAAIGVEYREEALRDEPDFLAQNELLSGGISARAQGSYNVREAYAEVTVPVLRDMPGAQSLELDAGIRYSDYNTFGNTSNAKFGVEWRPGGGLLLRGTYAEVFRAPTVGDLFTALTEAANSFTDPCNGLTAADLAANPNAAGACQNVTPNGTFNQTDSQLNAFIGGNPGLTPEEGEVITYGFAWTPEFLSRLYLEVDMWKIELDNTIGVYGTQTILDACYQRGQFCDLYSRDPQGEIFSLTDTQKNIGALDTEGTDFAIQYSFPESAIGKFRARVDATYLIKFDSEAIQGDPSTLVHDAGRFRDASVGGNGHFARWRGLGAVDWTLGQFSATARARYIGTVVEDAPDGALGITVEREIPDQVILNLQGTYRSPWGVDLTLGIDNVTDELAPLIYTGFNGTTDVRTYDGIGRFYYLKLNFKG